LIETPFKYKKNTQILALGYYPEKVFELLSFLSLILGDMIENSLNLGIAILRGGNLDAQTVSFGNIVVYSLNLDSIFNGL
jgi:hypothetical protein